MALKKKVMIIEDDLDTIDLLKVILELRGYEPLPALGGKAGLRLLQEVEPDLILLDLMMPEMDGWQVYRQLKADERLRQIPVIAVTAKAQEIDRVVGLQIAGMDDFIIKPFALDELVASVERVLGVDRER